MANRRHKGRLAKILVVPALALLPLSLSVWVIYEICLPKARINDGIIIIWLVVGTWLFVWLKLVSADVGFRSVYAEAERVFGILFATFGISIVASIVLAAISMLWMMWDGSPVTVAIVFCAVAVLITLVFVKKPKTGSHWKFRKPKEEYFHDDSHDE